MYNRFVEAKLRERMMKKRAEVQRNELILEALCALRDKILSDPNFDSSTDYMRLTNISFAIDDITKLIKK